MVTEPASVRKGAVAYTPAMPWFGRTQRRVIAAILVTAIAPLCASILIGMTMIQRISQTAFNPEFGDAMERSLHVYADLVQAIKHGMRAEADAIASRGELRALAAGDDVSALEGELASLASEHASLTELIVQDAEGGAKARWTRPVAVDPQTEKTLTVLEPLDDGAGELLLSATFATDATRFTETESLQELVRAYRQIESKNRVAYVDETYQSAFGVLLAATIALAVILGVLVIRPVTTGIARLAAATRPVAAGDLDVRVDVHGKDEVADLGHAFNRMLGELAESRARVEFLKRMSEWQQMARRLAHEIKNPLTPIQLAVEECHRRYQGDDPEYRRVVQTTLEVVEEEVGSLRRLVAQFSEFARLPRAELEETDLADFLRREAARMDASSGRGESDRPVSPGNDEDLLAHIDVSFDVADAPMPAAIDREMLHRVLSNLVRNAAQALRDARRGPGDGGGEDPARWGAIRVRLSAEAEGYLMEVEDDGPGVERELWPTIFDPYVTTKRDGTGLGLAIVKKVIVDHGGRIEVGRSEMGGARFRIRLPRAGTAASSAAIERSREQADEER